MRFEGSAEQTLNRLIFGQRPKCFESVAGQHSIGLSLINDPAGCVNKSLQNWYIK